MGSGALTAALLATFLGACSEEPETIAARSRDETGPPRVSPAPAPKAPTAPAPAAPPEGGANPGAADPTTGPGKAELEPMPATVARATALKAKPFLDAQTLASLPAGSAVTVLARDGGWYRVAAGGRQGWVRLLHLSTQARARGLGREELESAARVATGRQGGGNIASTTGVRGLTPEQLRAAGPDAGELERLERHAVGADEAQAWARAHGLARRDIPFLPEPE
jgi:hypothetical protein